MKADCWKRRDPCRGENRVVTGRAWSSRVPCSFRGMSAAPPQLPSLAATGTVGFFPLPAAMVMTLRALIRCAPSKCLQIGTFWRPSCTRVRLAGHFARGSVQKRTHCARYFTSTDLPQHIAPFFTFWPSYFSGDEQRLLLSAALQRLDSMDSVKMRRRRAKHQSPLDETGDIQGIFAPDNMYDFHEVRPC
jgi:hypothetical protein